MDGKKFVAQRRKALESVEKLLDMQPKYRRVRLRQVHEFLYSVLFDDYYASKRGRTPMLVAKFVDSLAFEVREATIDPRAGRARLLLLVSCATQHQMQLVAEAALVTNRHWRGGITRAVQSFGPEPVIELLLWLSTARSMIECVFLQEDFLRDTIAIIAQDNIAPGIAVDLAELRVLPAEDESIYPPL